VIEKATQAAIAVSAELDLIADYMTSTSGVLYVLIVPMD
jgi:hypothetical protein